MAPFIKYTSGRTVSGQPKQVENFVNADHIGKASYDADEQRLTLVLSIPDPSGKNMATNITIEGEEAKAAVEVIRKL